LPELYRFGAQGIMRKGFILLTVLIDFVDDWRIAFYVPLVFGTEEFGYAAENIRHAALFDVLVCVKGVAKIVLWERGFRSPFCLS
jgi:hypothetical protein